MKKTGNKGQLSVTQLGRPFYRDVIKFGDGYVWGCTPVRSCATVYSETVMKVS